MFSTYSSLFGEEQLLPTQIIKQYVGERCHKTTLLGISLGWSVGVRYYVTTRAFTGRAKYASGYIWFMHKVVIAMKSNDDLAPLPISRNSLSDNVYKQG